jgi:hypothetical protein
LSALAALAVLLSDKRVRAFDAEPPRETILQNDSSHAPPLLPQGYNRFAFIKSLIGRFKKHVSAKA